MSNYSKGIISIPEVTGNIVITVTTEGQAVNLFDSSTANYNKRINSTGVLKDGNGIVVTAPIDVRNFNTLTVSGITEVLSSGYNYYAMMCAYSDPAGTTASGSPAIYQTEKYTFDVSSASYVRLALVLSAASAISTADTTNLTIYGS